MKARLLFASLAAMALMISSCNPKKNEPTPAPTPAPGVKPTPEDPIKEQLVAKYKNVSDLKLVQKGQYSVATFVSNNLPMEAWFDNNDGKKWVLTQTKTSFDALPEGIKHGVTSSDYKTWKVENADLVERPGVEPMYVVGMKENENEIKLYFTSGGMLIKTLKKNDKTNDYSPYLLPNIAGMASVHSYLDKHYPKAKILEISLDQEDNYIEVDVLFGLKHYELRFHPNGTWFDTRRDNGEENDRAYKQVSQEARDAIAKYIADHHPEAVVININYDQDSKGYEVDIRKSYVKFTIFFDSTLKVYHTGAQAPSFTENVRKTILKYISQNYSGAVITEIEEVPDRANTNFEVFIRHENTTHALVFDGSGKFLSKNSYH